MALSDIVTDIEPIEHKPLTVREQWLHAHEREFKAQTNVTIDMDRLDEVINAMKVVTNFSYWKVYVSEVDKLPDLDKLAYEMAIATGMNSGYITVNGRNKPKKWHLNGSGTDGMIEVLKLIRKAGGMPDPKKGRPYSDALKRIIQPILERTGIPRPAHRLAIFEELGTVQAFKFIKQLMEDSYQEDGFHFTCAHVQKLARQFPNSFGGDELLYKKASLYFLLMGLALNELGFPAKVETLVPSEYRLPQVFAAYGVIRMSSALEKKIASKTPLLQGSEEVRALRQASVILVEEIMRRTGLPVEKVDGALYMMTKTPEFARRAKHMPHMMVDTGLF